jgi:hypothetical protein
MSWHGTPAHTEVELRFTALGCFAAFDTDPAHEEGTPDER